MAIDIYINFSHLCKLKCHLHVDANHPNFTAMITQETIVLFQFNRHCRILAKYMYNGDYKAAQNMTVTVTSNLIHLFRQRIYHSF